MPTELPPWLERLPERLPPSLDPLLDYLRLDFTPRHRQPSTIALVAATVVAIIGSLAADALLVMLGKKLFPATVHYGHFQFSDYSKLTVIGVLIACVAWPIVTRISSSPRWMFFRQAIAVTLVLLLPDLYIWYQGQSAQGVGVLVVMHLAIALVTYNALVHIAKTGEPEAGPYSPSAGRQDFYEDYYRDSRYVARRDVPSGSSQNYQEYRDPWEPRREARPARSHRNEAGPWT